MAELAWAVEIAKENYQAILSEAGSSFDRDFLESWVAENGEGFFLRDSTSPLDCYLFDRQKFLQLYSFERGDAGAMFRQVSKN